MTRTRRLQIPQQGGAHFVDVLLCGDPEVVWPLSALPERLKRRM